MQALNILVVHFVHGIHFLDLRADEFFEELFLFHFFNPNGDGSGEGDSDVTVAGKDVFAEELSDLVSVLVLDHELLLQSFNELSQHFKDTFL